MVGGKGGQLVGAAAHQRRRHQVAETQGADLFVPGPKRRRPVQHPHAGPFAEIEQVGGIEVGLIHGRVLAHPHPGEVVQGQQLGFLQPEPGLGHLPAGLSRDEVGQAHGLGPHPGAMAAVRGGGPNRQGSGGGEVAHGADPHLLAGPLGRLHQGHARILGGPQPRDRIDDEQLGLLQGSGSQQRIELAGALEGMQVIATAHVLAVDEGLGHAAAAAALGGHGGAGRLIAIDGELGVADALAIEQGLGPHAEGAGAPGVDLHGCHGCRRPKDQVSGWILRATLTPLAHS